MSGNASEKEKQMLNEWFYPKDETDVIIYTDNPDLGKEIFEESEAQLLRAIGAKGDNIAAVVPIKRKHKQAIAVAAGIMILLTATAIWYAVKPRSSSVINDTAVAKKGVNNSRFPTLLLADGRTITLDEPGLLAQVDDVGFTLTGRDTLIITASMGLKMDVAAPTGNTLTVPEERELTMVLPDGSTIRLNSLSTLAFAGNFSGSRREVVLTSGEAYFDVVHDKSRPFYVKTPRTEIQVLGTSFNVNAYDKSAEKTTLVEGLIKIRTLVATGTEQLLRPSQQALTDNSGSIAVKVGIDIDQECAWKEGTIVYDKVPLSDIMKQIARKYNVTVRYAKGVDTEMKVVFSYPRKAELAQVLSILKTVGVNIEQHDNAIVILP